MCGHGDETLADGRAVDAVISEATGLIIDLTSLTKLAWLLDNVEGSATSGEKRSCVLARSTVI